MKECVHCGRVGVLGFVVESYGGRRFIKCDKDAGCSARASARLIERHVMEARLARMRAAPMMERRG